MLRLEIDEEVRTAEDFLLVLDRIRELICQGYTSGYEPSWSLVGTDEEPADPWGDEDEDDVAATGKDG